MEQCTQTYHRDCPPSSATEAAGQAKINIDSGGSGLKDHLKSDHKQTHSIPIEIMREKPGPAVASNLPESSQSDENDSGGQREKRAQSNRKQWHKSPESVRELTRSLSRMNNPNGGTRTVEQEHSRMITRTPIMVDLGLPTKEYSNAYHQAQTEPGGVKTNQSFLPPLTGFSDSDSFEARCSTAGGGGCGDGCGHGDDHEVHCICESLKKTSLKEQCYGEPEVGVDSRLSYYRTNGKDAGAEVNWIVSRPERRKPKDNLRLEGPMDLETTFRSTYEDTAKRMIGEYSLRKLRLTLPTEC